MVKRPKLSARLAAAAGAFVATMLPLGGAVVSATSAPSPFSPALSLPAATSDCAAGPNRNPGPSPSPSASPPPTATGGRTAPSPSPSPPPCIGIGASPSSGLADGQYVRLTFYNLQPYEAMAFRQCIAGWVNVNTDCTPKNTHIIGQADANGGSSTYLPVYADANEKLNNSNNTPIACDLKHSCEIDGFTNYGHIYEAPISFAASPYSCPPIGPNAVAGSGSAAATRAMYRWSASVCLPPKSLQVSYITSNEHAAYDDLAKGLTEFGITGLGPYPPAGDSGGPSYKLAPITASAVVLAYRAYDMNGSQITNLTLTPDIIAGLFMGQVNNFSAVPAITQLNPGIAFPPRTTVVARAEFNTETYMLTSWLQATAPKVWKPPTSPSSDVFPSTGIDLKFGERGDALDIVDPSTGFDSSVVYVGVMDSSTAAFYGLPTVNLAMPDGSVLSANTASITRAIGDMAQLANGTLVPQWANFADQKAWPMPNITYMLAPTDKIDPQRGQTVSDFLKYAVQDGQSLVTGIDGYVKLPLPLVADSLAIASQIPVPLPTASTPSQTVAPPAIPALPPLPSTAGSTGGGTSTLCSSAACPAPSGGAASNARIVTLSYSQGQELSAVARQAQLGAAPRYAIPAILLLTALMISVGVGLRVWAWASARGAPGP